MNNLCTYKVINALFYMLRPLLYYQRGVGLLLAFKVVYNNNLVFTITHAPIVQSL